MRAVEIISVMDTFVQNPHDHPLFLVFEGEKCWDLADRLSLVFNSENSIAIEVDDLGAAMRNSMPVHFSHRTRDYVMFAKVVSDSKKKLFVGFNHLFHDISSVSALISGRNDLSSRCFVADQCIKRVPRPSELPCFKPRKVSKIHFSHDDIKLQTENLSCTTNEFLFFRSTATLSKSLKRSFEFMCLHSARKSLNQSRDTSGDYSCFVKPLHVEFPNDGININDVKSYFAKLRSGEAVLRNDDSTVLGDADNFWIFDTWVGSGIGRSFDDGATALDGDVLMNMMNMFIDKLVIAVDTDAGVDMYMYSDEICV